MLDSNIRPDIQTKESIEKQLEIKNKIKNYERENVQKQETQA